MKAPSILSLIFIMSAPYVYAENITAIKSLEKLKSNVEAAQKNKTEFEQNLQLVKGNVSEVQKAKEATLNQKKTVAAEFAKNSESLKKILNNEREISILLTKETEKLNLENKQVELLQNQIAEIKKNQEQRNTIITEYQNQLSAAVTHKKSWKDREDQLKQQEIKNEQTLRGLASDESAWLDKKKKYESEFKRWSVETDKQKRIHDTYRAMSEGK